MHGRLQLNLVWLEIAASYRRAMCLPLHKALGEKTGKGLAYGADANVVEKLAANSKIKGREAEGIKDER